jgi:hypothetical protein
MREGFMAATKCFYCDGLVFELNAAQILDCAKPHCFIQCAKCGMPVGVVESQHIGTLLAEQTERDSGFRAAITTRLHAIDHKLSQILEMLGQQKSSSSPA